MEREKVIRLFEYLYQQTSGSPYFKFKSTERENKMIDNFVYLLPENYGDVWLFDFMTFQFSRYYDQNTRFGRGKVMLGWVIGKKALAAFRTATEEQFYYVMKFKEICRVKNILLTPTKVEFSSNYKNDERKRFFNTDRGLLHCTEMNLFEEKNKICVICKNRNFCLKI